ncbi:MAG: 3-hydroxybutyrate oligomer hydrolase family protein [Caulobacter sp.]
MRARRARRGAGSALAGLAALAAAEAIAAEPSVRVMRHHVYDGVSEDLVGLAARPAPYADPLAPTAPELRRVALAMRADPDAGWGRLFGPSVDAATGRPYPDDGRVAGEEYLAYLRAPDGGESAALLQIPAGLSRTRRCLLAVPQSGSSGLYRDVAGLGFWGLQHGCAVVYTDKGHGGGAHDLETGTVNAIDGVSIKARGADGEAQFVAPIGEAARRRFLVRQPHRIAFKAAQSLRNPEARWGDDVLRAIDFALNQLNVRDGGGWTAQSTLVIVSGGSNGGGAALYAGEKDVHGLIDGVVAGEPQVQVRPNDQARVLRAGRPGVGSGRTLLDYFTYGNLYAPCAVLARPDMPGADRIVHAAERCASLAQAGLLKSASPAELAREAEGRLVAYGFEPETLALTAFGYLLGPDATAAKYAGDHGRFGVEDRVCGYSYASTDAAGVPRAVPRAELAEIFARGGGGAPVGSIDLVNDDDPRGPLRNDLSLSPSTGRADYNLDGALCLRELAVGRSAKARRVQAGIAEFLASGDLHGKPAIIVHGRADNRVPAAFSSRPYLALNSLAEGGRGRLRYLEVENAEHFGFSGPGFDTRFVPLTYYHLRALDLMWAHLTEGAPLPDSQIVRTRPRGGTPGHAPPLTLENIPPIALRAPPRDRIIVQGGVVGLPD